MLQFNIDKVTKTPTIYNYDKLIYLNQ
jgi:hypothetical protein